jgi:hypothetical protein
MEGPPDRGRVNPEPSAFMIAGGLGETVVAGGDGLAWLSGAGVDPLRPAICTTTPIAASLLYGDMLILRSRRRAHPRCPVTLESSVRVSVTGS